MWAPGRRVASFLFVAILSGLVAFSQEGAESPAEAPREAASVKPPPGDVITLKSGKKLLGFQVVRQTTREVVVRVMEGVEMTLPMRQVASVELDEIDPTAPGKEQEAGKPEHELIPGIKLAPALYEKLVRPVSQEAFTFANEDAIHSIVALSQQAEVPLEIAAALEQVPAEQRRWTVQIEPGATFFAILNHHLLGQFPDLAVIYRYDRLILTTKAEAEKDTGESDPTPPASPPPAAESLPDTPGGPETAQ